MNRRTYLQRVAGVAGATAAGTGLSGCAQTRQSPAAFTQSGKLAASDGDSGDSFGGSVAVSTDGSTAVVGAQGDEDPNGEEAGSAYVFERGDSFEQTVKLAPPDGDSYDDFGLSVGMSGDGSTVLVGAPGDENPNGDAAGSAYVFERDDSFEQTVKLTASDGDRGDGFGFSVAVSAEGSTAILGAKRDADPNGTEAGSAYVFERGDSWEQAAKLVPEDGDRRDSFGQSVGISASGSTAVVGASFDSDPNGDDAGSAYVFERGRSWEQAEKLAAVDGDNDDSFGRSVALSGDGSTVLVGAWDDDAPNGPHAGSAYVFQRADGAGSLSTDDRENWTSSG